MKAKAIEALRAYAKLYPKAKDKEAIRNRAFGVVCLVFPDNLYLLKWVRSW